MEPGAKKPVPSVIRTNAPTIWVPAQCRGQAERSAGPQKRKRLPLAGRREAGSRALRAGVKDTREARGAHAGLWMPPLPGPQHSWTVHVHGTHTAIATVHTRGHHAHPQPRTERSFVSNSAQKCHLFISAPHPHSNTTPPAHLTGEAGSPAPVGHTEGHTQLTPRPGARS